MSCPSCGTPGAKEAQWLSCISNAGLKPCARQTQDSRHALRFRRCFASSNSWSCNVLHSYDFSDCCFARRRDIMYLEHVIGACWNSDRKKPIVYNPELLLTTSHLHCQGLIMLETSWRLLFNLLKALEDLGSLYSAFFLSKSTAGCKWQWTTHHLLLCGQVSLLFVGQIWWKNMASPYTNMSTFSTCESAKHTCGFYGRKRAS